MALFGRETAGERQRVERLQTWMRARSPYALFSVLFGAVAALDFLTLVLGVALGSVALVLGAIGLRELKRKPELRGRRLCVTGMVLGGAGIVLSTVFFFVVLPRLG